jgi:hypothetical protein
MYVHVFVYLGTYVQCVSVHIHAFIDVYVCTRVCVFRCTLTVYVMCLCMFMDVYVFVYLDTHLQCM